MHQNKLHRQEKFRRTSAVRIESQITLNKSNLGYIVWRLQCFGKRDTERLEAADTDSGHDMIRSATLYRHYRKINIFHILWTELFLLIRRKHNTAATFLQTLLHVSTLKSLKAIKTHIERFIHSGNSKFFSLIARTQPLHSWGTIGLKKSCFPKWTWRRMHECKLFTERISSVRGSFICNILR